MPTRLLREGILDSSRVNQLDWPAEVFYRRLMSKVDDHGLYDARPAILRAHLYPLKIDRVREADISRWIAECEKAGLIVLYEAENKPYLQMLNVGWEARSKPKYPPPPDNNCKQSETTGNNCSLDGDVVEDVDDRGKRPRFKPPNKQEVIDYFVANGYTAEAGGKAFDYYDEGGWKDSSGKQVRNWKQKMRGVWFKPENKADKLDKKPI